MRRPPGVSGHSVMSTRTWRERSPIRSCDAGRATWPASASGFDCFTAALRAGALAEAGSIMSASHASLARDFEVSTPALDSLVEMLTARPGVFGARLTGAGFGGCVVALTEPGALDVDAFPTPAWRVRAAPAARLVTDG